MLWCPQLCHCHFEGNVILPVFTGSHELVLTMKIAAGTVWIFLLGFCQNIWSSLTHLFLLESPLHFQFHDGAQSDILFPFIFYVLMSLMTSWNISVGFGLVQRHMENVSRILARRWVGSYPQSNRYLSSRSFQRHFSIISRWFCTRHEMELSDIQTLELGESMSCRAMNHMHCLCNASITA